MAIVAMTRLIYSALCLFRFVHVCFVSAFGRNKVLIRVLVSRIELENLSLIDTMCSHLAGQECC